MHERRSRLISLAFAAVSALAAGCGGGEAASNDKPVKISDPGPVHVHGLGVDPSDDSLFIATHTGLFRAAEGQRKAKRVADRYQDTMGFTVVGPAAFLGSGHPDGRDRLPPFLGLIRSKDAGRTWQPVSLLGKRDFHLLEASGKRVYGFGSAFDTRETGFLVSADGGRRWEEREVPEPLVSLAVSSRDPDRVVASGERRLYLSEDAGRAWRPVDGPAGLLAWTDELIVLDGNGRAYAAADAGRRPRPVGDLGGQPAAFDSGPGGDLYAALHDGKIKRSTDRGRSWALRSAP